MQSNFTKLILALGLIGAASFALGTSCATKKSVLPMVEAPTTPSLVALYNGRYSLSKGFSCSWSSPIYPPRVSVLVASERIWIGLSYDEPEGIPEEIITPYVDFLQVADELPLTFDEYGYYPAELGPKDRRWTIPSNDGRHDWTAAHATLLEIRELLNEDEQERADLEAASEGFPSYSQPILALAESYSMEIAAEDEVPYENVIAAIDLAVASDFEDFAYVDATALPEWLKE